MHPHRTSTAPQPRFARRRATRPIPRRAYRRFGRGPARVHAIALQAPQAVFSEGLKLFATTYAAAFLFVTCLIA